MTIIESPMLYVPSVPYIYHNFFAAYAYLAIQILFFIIIKIYHFSSCNLILWPLLLLADYTTSVVEIFLLAGEAPLVFEF